jgi:hypothetical protein
LYKYAYILLCLALAVKAAGKKPVTWYDRGGHEHSREELDRILIAHDNWQKSDGGIRANLSHAELYHVDLRKARLRKGDLSNVLLFDVNLGGADLVEANFRRAIIVGANLSGAHLMGTDLSGARLLDVDLSGADVSLAHFNHTIYEPKSAPILASMAITDGLGTLTWEQNSGPIYALRESFEEAGFRAQARQVNAAIHRHDQNSFEKILFDWTCEWGASYLRPLGVAGALCLIYTLIYWVGMHWGRRSGLYLVATGQRITTGKGTDACSVSVCTHPAFHRIPISLHLHSSRAAKSGPAFSDMYGKKCEHSAPHSCLA